MLSQSVVSFWPQPSSVHDSTGSFCILWPLDAYLECEMRSARTKDDEFLCTISSSLFFATTWSHSLMQKTSIFHDFLKNFSLTKSYWLKGAVLSKIFRPFCLNLCLSKPHSQVFPSLIFCSTTFLGQTFCIYQVYLKGKFDQKDHLVFYIPHLNRVFVRKAAR